jgi:hypothetical protein
VRNRRWFINIDHLEDSDLEFLGWYKVVDSHDFSVYRRPHDGEEQVIQNDPPRVMVVDDYNDAQVLSSGRIIVGPENH